MALQVFIQMLLAVIIFAQVNYIGCRRYERWDMTQTGRFTLSTVSQNFLDGLDSDIHLVMAFMRRSDLFSEVEGMLSRKDIIAALAEQTDIDDEAEEPADAA